MIFLLAITAFDPRCHLEYDDERRAFFLQSGNTEERAANDDGSDKEMLCGDRGDTFFRREEKAQQDFCETS